MEDTKNQEKTGKKATQKPKGTQFAFLIYPESLPQNWEDELEATGLRCAISPLHDKDINKDGTLKKAHYHGIIVAKNPVTTQAMRNKLAKVLGKSVASQVQFIKKSIPDAYAYFTHSTKQARADKKFQYDEKEIKLMNGFDVHRYDMPLDEYDKDNIIDEVCDIIEFEGLTHISQVNSYVRGSNLGFTVKDMRKSIRGCMALINSHLDAAFREKAKSEREQERIDAQLLAEAQAQAESDIANVLCDVYMAIIQGDKPEFPDWVIGRVERTLRLREAMEDAVKNGTEPF